MTPVTHSHFCEHLSPLSPLAHRYVCLSCKMLQKTGVGHKRRFSSDSTTGDSGDSGDSVIIKRGLISKKLISLHPETFTGLTLNVSL